MNSETLTQLLPLLRSDDSGAWDRIYLELGPKLVHFAHYKLGLTVQDAEDCAQEVLINIFTKRETIIRLDRLELGYFFKQVYWKGLAHWRKRARETALDALKPQVLHKILEKIATDHQRIVDKQYENIDELRVVFEQCWCGLDAREQKVLHLRFFESLTLRETGEQMGISLHTVKSIETRAIGKLRAWLLPLES
jgi:RNA polymerase sigma factor (sigma-70 family)